MCGRERDKMNSVTIWKIIAVFLHAFLGCDDDKVTREERVLMNDV